MANTNITISADDKTSIAFDAVNARLGKLNNNVANLTKVSGAAGLAISATVGFFVTSTKNFANYADEIGKGAQKIGSSTEKLSELRYAGELADVTFEQLQTGLGKLAKTAKDFQDGSTSAVDAFNEIDIDPRKFTDTGDLFTAIAEKLSKMEDGARKTALAQELLGKSGKELIPLLNEGAAGLDKFADEAKRLGLVIDKETSAAAEEFNDDMVRLEKSTSLLGRTLGKDLIPSLAETARLLAEDVKQGNLLTATFRALAGLGKLPFDLLFPDPDPSVGAHIEELTVKISNLKRAIDGGFSDGKDGAANQRKELAILENQLKGYLKFRDKLAKPPAVKATTEEEVASYDELAKSLGLASVKFAELDAKQKEASKSFAAGAITLEQYQEITKKIQKDRDALNKTSPAKTDKDAEAAANFIEKLKKEAETLELTKPQLLEYDAAHLKLTETQKLSAASLIKTIKAYEDMAAATKEWVEQEKLLQEFNNRDVERTDEEQATEDAEFEERQEAFANLSQTLQQENENLNIGLLTSDKKRARAQLDLEHARAVERIQGMIAEGDEVQQLLDQETANYELRIKQMDATSNAARELGLTFTSAFEDAVVGGEELSDVLEALLDDIAKFALRKGFTEPALDLLSGFDFGSLFGGISDLPDFVPSFAVGTDYVPHDMIAQIHKGERIVPAAENNGYGGGDTIVNISVDAKGSSVEGSNKQASELGRMIAGAVQSELIKQKRPGGILAPV
jgi:hypothetical protein